MADFFCTVLDSLPAFLKDAIHLCSDLPNQNLVLVLMAKRERGAYGERSQVIQAFCDLLLRILG